MADYRIVTETGVEDRIADATSGLLSKTAADGIYVPLSGPRRRPRRRHRRGCADPRQLPVTPPIPEHHVLAWAGQNPTLAGAVTAYLPNTDLAATAANGTYGPSVNAAYGGKYVQGTHGANHNPITQAGLGKFAGVPINLVYASDDPLIAYSYPESFAAAVGSNAVLINGGATGHEWPVTTGATAKAALLAQMAAI